MNRGLYRWARESTRLQKEKWGEELCVLPGWGPSSGGSWLIHSPAFPTAKWNRWAYLHHGATAQRATALPKQWGRLPGQPQAQRCVRMRHGCVLRQSPDLFVTLTEVPSAVRRSVSAYWMNEWMNGIGAERSQVLGHALLFASSWELKRICTRMETKNHCKKKKERKSSEVYNIFIIDVNQRAQGQCESMEAI